MVKATMEWYKSSFCETAACLEAAPVGESAIAVRNNAHPGERHLEFDRDGWNVFLDDIAEGRFSNL